MNEDSALSVMVFTMSLPLARLGFWNSKRRVTKKAKSRFVSFIFERKVQERMAPLLWDEKDER